MPKITIIGRISDGLPLAASMADEKDAYARELDTYERQAKKILRSLSRQQQSAQPPPPPYGVPGVVNGYSTSSDPSSVHYRRSAAADPNMDPDSGGSGQTDNFVSVESGTHFTFHYLCDRNVCFLTLTEKAYPKKLACDYLRELRNEFFKVHGAQIEAATRPYEFIRFDTFIQKTKKLYVDSKTQRNLQKLNNELKDIHSIMTKNIQDVINRGEKLDNVTQKSTRLASESKKYASQAQHANTMRIIKQYSPIAIILLIVILVILWFKWRK